LSWKKKALVLGMLSRMPGGRRVYHALQRMLGTNKPDPDEYLSRALEIVRMMREHGASPEGAAIFEIGTGWWPFVPFLLALAGARRIITVDINPWLHISYALQTHEALGGRLDMIGKELDIPSATLQARYEATRGHAGSLAGLLEAYRAEYRCPGDARATGLGNDSVDLVVSSNVFAHVPPDILKDIHRESFRILKPGGLGVYRFNLDDSYWYDDQSITSVNFLRFSEVEWRRYGRGLAYHNRLRGVQHRQLLEEAGFKVLSDKTRVDARAVAAIESGALPVHADFAGFKPEQLAAAYIWMVCRRPSQSEVSTTGS
jgi:SAM-dependent methyltransferase